MVGVRAGGKLELSLGPHLPYTQLVRKVNIRARKKTRTPSDHAIAAHNLAIS